MSGQNAMTMRKHDQRLLAVGAVVVTIFGCCGLFTFFAASNACTGTGSVIYQFANECHSGGYQAVFLGITLVLAWLAILFSQDDLSPRRRMIIIVIFLLCALAAMYVVYVGTDATPHIPPGTNLG
jgi:hypothetical protein